MAKAAIVKKYNISASGVLSIENNIVGIENPDTGEFFDLSELLSDFADKSIKMSVSYDEDYGVDE